MDHCTVPLFKFVRTWKSFAIIVGILVAFPTNGHTQSSDPSLPKLLQNVTATGGYMSACPPSNSTEEMMLKTWKGRLAISPEFNQRLRDEFPPGSEEKRLIQTLTTQGFMIIGQCDKDPTIWQATFNKKGQGFLRYDTSALVFWKSDVHKRLIWTKGMIFRTGL